MGQVDELVTPRDQWLPHKEGEAAPVPGGDVYEMNLKDKTKKINVNPLHTDGFFLLV